MRENARIKAIQAGKKVIFFAFSLEFNVFKMFAEKTCS